MVTILKQQKDKQKKGTKGKGFEKTSDNWKAASENFRAAVKAIKKDTGRGREGRRGRRGYEDHRLQVLRQALRRSEEHIETCGRRNSPRRRKH